MVSVRTGERKLKFDTSARYIIASYGLTVSTQNRYSEQVFLNRLQISVANA